MKIPFPPEFPPEKNIFETCVRNYIDATKPESLEMIECGICGESVKKDSDLYEEKNANDIANIGLLSTENSNVDHHLEEYVHEGYIDVDICLLSKDSHYQTSQ